MENGLAYGNLEPQLVSTPPSGLESRLYLLLHSNRDRRWNRGSGCLHLFNQYTRTHLVYYRYPVAQHQRLMCDQSSHEHPPVAVTEAPSQHTHLL